MANTLSPCIKDFILAMLDAVRVTTLVNVILTGLSNILKISILSLEAEIINYDIIAQIIALTSLTLQTGISLGQNWLGQLQGAQRFRSCPPVNDFLSALDTSLDRANGSVAEEEYRTHQTASITAKTKRLRDKMKQGADTIDSMINNLNAIVSGIEGQGIGINTPTGQELLRQRIVENDFNI